MMKQHEQTNSNINTLTNHVKEKFENVDANINILKENSIAVHAEMEALKKIISNHEERFIKLESFMSQGNHGNQGYNNGSNNGNRAGQKQDHNKVYALQFSNWPFNNLLPLDMFTQWDMRK